MNETMRKLILALESGSELDNTLLCIAQCFEKHSGASGEELPAEIQDSSFSDQNVNELKSALRRFIDRTTELDKKGTAVWAFGKAVELNDVRYLQKVLMEALSEDPHTLFQTLVALSNAGESLLVHGNYSIFEHETNREIAARYLAAALSESRSLGILNAEK